MDPFHPTCACVSGGFFSRLSERLSQATFSELRELDSYLEWTSVAWPCPGLKRGMVMVGGQGAPVPRACEFKFREACRAGMVKMQNEGDDALAPMAPRWLVALRASEDVYS
jgi:hypothetical protein